MCWEKLKDNFDKPVTLSQNSSLNITSPLNNINTTYTCLLYADDMILLSESKSGLQDQLDLLGNYCDKWFLKINPEKSQTMCIRPLRSKIESSNMSFTMNGSILKSTTSYVYLGAMINEKGNFKMQTDYMSSKALTLETRIAVLVRLLLNAF